MASSHRSSTRTFKTSRQLEIDNMPEKKVKPPKRPINIPKLKVPKKNLSLLIIVVLLVATVFLFVQYRSAQNKLQGNAYDKDLKQLRKMILLPQEEKPTYALVKDVSKLSSNRQFKDAKNGDLLFIYPKANKAIIYRPSTKMIINVGQAHN